MAPRQFHGEAAQVVQASVEDCYALVAAVDRYPDWCPEQIREAEVLAWAAGGHPRSVRLGIHIDRGPITRDFHLYLTVAAQPYERVTLTRFTDHPTNQEFTGAWLLREAGGTEIALRLDALLRVPRYIPDGGIPDAIAEGLVGAACDALSSRP